MSRRIFSNPWPDEDEGHSFLAIFKWKFGFMPKEPVTPGATDDAAPWQPIGDVAVPPEKGWRMTWFGHSSFLVQGMGRSLLIDPVFSDYCSPVPIRSLRRRVATPCSIDELPKIDAVLLTHGHYDHLDLPTLRALGKDMPLVIAEGHAEWLGKQGFQRVKEVPWWASVELAPGLTVTAVPAKHFTARTPWDRNHGHWCGWVIEGTGKKLWHAGDSAWCPAFKEIGDRFGPIDLGMIPIGAYNPREIMKSVHVNPEEALRMFQETRCKQAVAMHWGTFRLTDEPMSEPVVRLKAACEKEAVETFRPVKVGESVEV